MAKRRKKTDPALDRDDQPAEELAKKTAQAEKKKPSATKPPATTPGVIELTLETPAGEVKEVRVGINPQIPTIYFNRNKVSTAALLKLAWGGKLTDEEAAENAALAGLSEQEAFDYVAEWAAKGAGWLSIQ